MKYLDNPMILLNHHEHLPLNMHISHSTQHFSTFFARRQVAKGQAAVAGGIAIRVSLVVVEFGLGGLSSREDRGMGLGFHPGGDVYRIIYAWMYMYILCIVYMYIHMYIYIYLYVNFIPGSFHVTLGSGAPLGLVERIRLSAISWQPEPGSGSSLTASARVKIQVSFNEVGRFI